MSGRFTIDFDWLPRETGSIEERATFAEVRVNVDGKSLIDLEDLRAKTVRSAMRISAYHLALWFAANWWRLHHEPERKTCDWRLSHCLAAAGGGYSWPNLTFVGDGQFLTIQATASKPGTDPHDAGSGPPAPGWRSPGGPIEPVRYLTESICQIPVESFTEEVDSFVGAVIERLKTMGHDDNDLARLWDEVNEERRLARLVAWRRLEAILGCEPGDAAEEVMRRLGEEADRVGICALEEVAAADPVRTLGVLESFQRDLRPRAIPVRIPHQEAVRQEWMTRIDPHTLPWQRAEIAARLARSAWGLHPGPLGDEALIDTFSLQGTTFSEHPDAVGETFGAGFRDFDGATGVYLNRRPGTGRRFAFARLIADHLFSASPQDRLLPASDAATNRQKFQRAFAQEFLCPFDPLMEFFGSGLLTDDRIEMAAEYFAVSPLLVKTTLVNRGVLTRTALLG